MKLSVKQYFLTFYDFAKGKLPALVVTACANSALEGAMLLLLVPFLYIARQMSGSLPADAPFALGFMAGFAESRYALVILLCLFVLVSVAQEYFRRRQMILSTLIKTGFSRSLSDRLYKAFAQAKWSYLISKRRSDIANALSNELKMIDMGTQILIQLATTLPLLVVQLAICAVISPEGTIAAVVVGALFFLFLRPVNKKLGNFSESINTLLKDSLSDVYEHLSGIKEVKSYGAEGVHIERFSIKNSGQMEAYVDFVKLFTRSSFIYNSGTFVLAAIFVFFSLTVFNEGLTRLIILFIVFLRVWPIFSGLQISMQLLMLMFPAWDSFADSLKNLKSEREEYFVDSGTKPHPLKEGIELRGVSFTYPEGQANALKDVSLVIPVNSSVAITGPSGSGKSTLIDIIIGLLKPTKGEILIDGEVLHPRDVPSWRMAIGFVPQETFLFRGTIRDNLLWAKPSATEEDIWRALELAAAADFIKEMQGGLDTYLGDRGTRLSGGQRQRIALARAALRQPSLLIMDEATSSIDMENEKKIHAAMERLKGKMTIITIAHRLSTIKSADHVVYIEDGRIVDKGFFADMARRFGVLNAKE